MIKSFAKINLFLNVLKKNKDGLHNIQSNTILVKLFDKIKIIKINKKKDLITFNGKFKKDINNKDNSILSALNLLRQKNLINRNNKYKIIIDKKIPVFAGLGGGTSNAFFLINYFLKDRFNEKLIQFFEKYIGSDFRLFFFKNSIQKSIKNIIKLNLKNKFFLVLVYPEIKCSTKFIYSKVKKYSKPLNFFNTSFKDNYFNNLKKQKNDLQNIIINLHPKIKKLLIDLETQKKCIFSRMTGSGSTCFAIFKEKKFAKIAFLKLKKKYPKYHFILTETL